VYTVEREPDFATNVVDGKYSDENISDLFSKSLTDVSIVDFDAYAPSNGDAASFVGAPVKNESGDLVGVVALQLPLDRINTIMQERSGLGESGETYLVGEDKLMRSDSRFSDEPTVLKQRIDTKTASMGLQGKTGAEIVPDYRGVNVLSAYVPIDVGDLHWAMLAEIDEEEAFSAVYAMERTMVLIGLIVAGLVALCGWLFARSISRPIARVTEVAQQIAVGDVEHTLAIQSKDEIGMLADSFRQLMDYMRELSGVAEQVADNNLTIDVEPKSDRDKLSQSFKTMVSNLKKMIHQLRENADQLVSAATEIASASEQASQGAQNQNEQVSQVSSAIEEMSATILQSTKNAGEATEASQRASETANSGGEIVGDTIRGMQQISETVSESSSSIGKLAQSAEQIGEIIGVIDDIADQTNLLALNAAIEAARAGEQGRGFAVVADEVRKLAERTGKATGEITDMIKGIQTDTDAAVQSMESGIQQVTSGRELADKAGTSLNEIVSVSQQVMSQIQQIAQASEEQSTAAEQISKNIEHIASVTKETATGAEQSAAAAEELNRQAEGLKSMVERFTV
ncbi:HAMP domain-containing protein, partial [candidate division GN15 bacterium]|nr:HAMP domain-containing protein [candidate division GN15 bacterium]